MLKKIPMRRCVATQESLPKKELLRIVRTPEGTLLIDHSGKANGHGAYLKKSEEAVQIARKNKALAKALSMEIPMSFYDEILKAISSK